MIISVKKIVFSLFLFLTIVLLYPYNTFATTEKKAFQVICYHTFLGNTNRYSFSIDELAKQISFLKERNFTFITFDDVLRQNYWGTKNVLITIDDGNKTVYEAYKKVFKPRGIKPLLAIYPAIIGRTRYGLTWKQLHEMVNDGCEVASHGLYHKKINTRLYEKEPKVFDNEITLSKKILEKNLKDPIKAFVYPYGITSKETVAALKKTGYICSFGVADGIIDPILFLKKKYRLPRYVLMRGNWNKSLKRIVKRSSTYKMPTIASSEKKETIIENELDPILEPIKEDYVDIMDLNPSITPAATPAELAKDVISVGVDDKTKFTHYSKKKYKEFKKVFTKWLDFKDVKRKYKHLTQKTQQSYRKFFKYFTRKVKKTGDGFISQFYKIKKSVSKKIDYIDKKIDSYDPRK